MVLLAVLLGNQLARPLLMLAAGVRDVAAGDLSPKPALQGRDELEGLTRSFADMTQQLSDTREALDRSMMQVHTSRANLQTILDNLTAGVIVMHADGVIQSTNPGATRILRVPLAAWEGRVLGDIEGLEEFAERVRDAKTYMRQGGYFTGGKLAAGYKVKNGKMVADNEWNLALTAMRMWRAEGMAYRTIAEKVKEQFGITLDHSTCFRILNNKRLLDVA